MPKEFGVTLDEAVQHLAFACEEAYDFMTSEFLPSWELDERYYAGEAPNVPTVDGRSSQVKTEVRDLIRAALPQIMRTIYHAQKPVEYAPRSMRHGQFVEQQELFVKQLFDDSNGFNALYSAIEEGLVLKAGPLKTYWLENPEAEYFATNLTGDQVLAFVNDPNFDITSIEEIPNPLGGDMAFYKLEGYQVKHFGKIVVEAFPVYEFFISRNATSVETAHVHGHRRNVTVAEAISMGLEHDDWESLDSDDPKANDAHDVEATKRGYTLYDDDNSNRSPDITQHEFLLTEVYTKLDMDGDGVPERYVFYLGGSGNEYLHHEPIEDYCIDLVTPIPTRFAPIGRSVAELNGESQDTMTSILRAIIDNAHICNNPRITANPREYDFKDILNNAIGAPIKKLVRGADPLQVTDVPFTGQALLGFLEYLDNDSAQKIGVTKAATGLDPDAMQSTDKNAVLNTIELSQAQLELMVRHVIQLALIPLFKRLLRLSIRHMDPTQIIKYRDRFIQVDTSNFDPDAIARPNAGLGTTSPQIRSQGLSFILEQQFKMMSDYGIDNPIVSLGQIFNTITDIAETMGIHNTARYLNYVSPEIESQIASNMAKAAEQEQQLQNQREQQELIADPAAAVIKVERIKAQSASEERQVKLLLGMRELEQKALADKEKLDIDRDRLAQQRVLEFLKIGSSADEQRLIREQDANDAD